MHADRPLTAPEAEQGVIGALMINPDLSETVGAFLDPQHFADEDMRALYQLALMACSKGQKPDAITLDELSSELPSGAPTMRTAGQIQISVTSAANAETYARILVERAKARQMTEIARQIHEMAHSRGRIADQVAMAQALVMDLISAEESPDVVTIREAMRPVFDQMDDRLNGRKVMGLDFGLKDLDDIVCMLRPGNLAIIAGRPGTGKTVLGVNLAEHVALRRNGSALIFSMEMAKEELAKRILASVGGVSQNSLDTGSALMEDDTRVRVESAVHQLHEAGIRICDKPALSLSRISAIARFQHRANPLSVIVIDYLGLMSSDPGSRHQNRNQELGAISRGLKALAKELGLPVVALAQLNRGIESRTDAKPRMSDLRDSGEIEQDADVIIMAHRDDSPTRGEQGITDIDVVKCRHAKPGSTILQFQGEFARFRCVADASRYEVQEQEAPVNRKSARGMLRAAQ